jgi:putative transposase
MARPYRIQGENCFYHITSRGDDRKKIYISEYDFKKFLEYLLKAKERFSFYLYAYVLMPNHYHLLIETLKPNLSRIMQYLNTAYTTYYNIKRKRCGHLFQGRYKSILVDKQSYFLELSRYIHLNPVRAKLVQNPEEYKWSSYKGYISKKGDGYIDKDRIKDTLDMNEAQYRQFVLSSIEAKEMNPFKDVYAGFMLGPTSFIKEKLQDLKIQVESGEISYKKTLTNIIEKENIIDAVAKKYGKTPEELYKSKNQPMKAKKVAIYLMKQLSNLTNSKIGETFGITYSAVSKAAADIEKLILEDKKIKKEVDEIISRFKV